VDPYIFIPGSAIANGKLEKGYRKREIETKLKKVTLTFPPKS
jgi:hypothetical protein